MPKQRLASMSVDALLKLRNEISSILSSRADALRRELRSLGEDYKKIGRIAVYGKKSKKASKAKAAKNAKVARKAKVAKKAKGTKKATGAKKATRRTAPPSIVLPKRARPPQEEAHGLEALLRHEKGQEA